MRTIRPTDLTHLWESFEFMRCDPPEDVGQRLEAAGLITAIPGDPGFTTSLKGETVCMAIQGALEDADVTVDIGEASE